jgi:MATE family multidrug resistance protein
LAEIGAFTLATFLIGLLGSLALAGHQIALNVASITFMVPMGISSAAAVRVGHAVGACDARGAAHSGWMALLFAAGFMSCSGLTLLFLARPIARIYTPDPAVVTAGARLLMVAAIFQLFDGIQVVATGALRGAGDTRTPMIANLAGYWAIGLPVGAYLCFPSQHGAVGMWAGLCLALILIGTTLLMVWTRLIRKLLSSTAVPDRVPLSTP